MPTCRLGPVIDTEGVDAVRALQRVLYRSAKQDPARRFHALYDKVARSDILWRAWVEVASNQGAPGVDGVTITSIADGGVVGVWAFLDALAQQLGDKTYRPSPLRRVHIPGLAALRRTGSLCWSCRLRVGVVVDGCFVLGGAEVAQ